MTFYPMETPSSSSKGHSNRRFPWFIVITLTCIAAIFLNSLMDSNLSSAQSGAVLHFLQKVIAQLGGNPEWITMHLVRKAAHFTEYAILGTLLFLSTAKKRRGWLYQPLFFGLLIPVLDESIQLLVPGRTGQVKDVLLDYAGVLFGMAIGAVLRAIWHWLFSKRKKESP